MAEAVENARRHFGGPGMPRAADLAACRAELALWYDQALRNYRDYADGYPGFHTLCRFAPTIESNTLPDEADVRAWLAPWREALFSNSASDPRLAVKWVIVYHQLLKQLGLARQAAPLFEAEIRTRIARAKPGAPDTRPADDLIWLSRYFFGQWQHQDDLRALQAWLEQGLGPAHRATLLALRAMAYHERFLGRPQQALALIERAAALSVQHHPGDAELAAHMASEHAACLSSVGRLVEARERMLLSRTFFVAQEPRPWLALVRIESNLAMIAADIGDHAQAVVHAEQALAWAQQSGQSGLLQEALVTQATKEMARLQARQADAAGRLRSNLERIGPLEMHVGSQAFALAEHAARHDDRQMLAWAADFTEAHIRNFRGPLQSDRALSPLMTAWREAGHALQSETVRPALDRAMAISLSRRSLGTLALTEFSMARHRTRADADTAIWLYKAGANALQELRTGLPSDQPQLHRAWLGSYEADLRAFIALLIDQGRFVEAEQALTLLRDEESHEFSRRSAHRRSSPARLLSYTGVETARNQGLATATAMAVQAAEEADARLETWSGYTLRTGYSDAEAQAHIENLTRFVHDLVDQVPTQRGLAASASPAPRRLPQGHARLNYLVREDGIDIVLQQGRQFTRRSAPLSRVDLNRLVQSARRTLATPQLDPRPALRALYDSLIGPVRAELDRADTRHLQLMPDAALRYLPFAALHDGQQFVAQRFVLSTRWAGHAAPVAAGMALPTRRARAGGLVALGRTRGDAEHAALPGVAQELAQAARLPSSRTWLDEGFSARRLQLALASGPDVVHLASHFVLDRGGEDRSYLLLGDGTQLTLDAMAALPWRGVRLALLSACDSGVAVDTGAGQALVGFASTLQRAGVREVLATLWRVSDGATARWIEIFYGTGDAAHTRRRRVGADGFDPQRVAHTQRRWLHRFAGTPLAHPHYWAAFTWLAGGD